MQHFAGHLFGGLDYFNWPKTTNGSTEYTQVYATTDTANGAIAALAGSEPFFLWVAFNAPHGPFHEPPDELLADPSIYNYVIGRHKYLAMIEAMDTEFGRIMDAVDLSDTTVIFVADNGTPGGFLEPPYPITHGKGTVYEGALSVPLIVAGEAWRRRRLEESRERSSRRPTSSAPSSRWPDSRHRRGATRCR